MRILVYSILVLLLTFGVAGCAVEIQQTPFVTTPNLPTSQPAILPENGDSPIPPKKQIPMTWAHLNLTGRLVYVFAEIIDKSIYAGVQVLDLPSGEVRTIFTAPPHGLIYDLAVSPDAKQVLISYSPPAEDLGIAYRSIYVMPLDGSEPPRQLLQPMSTGDEYFQAEWSPDGKYIYFTNFNYEAPPQENSIFPLYTIFRMAYPDGASEEIAENSLWVSVSPDSSQIVYVKYAGSSLQNKLYVADADGRNPKEVVLGGSWIPEIKDAPIFMPDGQSILFSGPVSPQAYQRNWLDKVMGVQIVKAHSVPSDWWLVPVSGGVPNRLTHLQTLGLFASIAPDKKHIASLSASGLFVMNLDGSNLIQLISDPGIQGAIRWIP